MAKTAKPNFYHSGPDVQTAPRRMPNNDQKKRKIISHQKRTEQAMTDVRWKKVISAIANGKTRKEAAEASGMTLQSIEAYLITNVAAYKQIRDAILVWNRASWSSELVDNVFNDLATGMTLKAAAIHNGIAAEKMHSLYRLVRFDKQVRETYDDARQLQAESFLDEIIEIADDSGKDRLENGRINHEVVNRSKLKIDTRRFAMGAMVKKRFGDIKHLEVEGSVTFNHIAMLTGARKRLEKVRTVKQPATIDNETGELSA